MSSAKSFEELFVWQKSRELVNLVYVYARKPKFSADRGLTDQITRAAVSVMSNIAEGFERGTREEFLYFLYVAKASCGETRTQIYVAFDQAYIAKDELAKAADLAKYVSSLIANLISSLKVSRFKGLKFKKPLDPKEIKLKELVKKYLPAERHSLLDY